MGCAFGGGYESSRQGYRTTARGDARPTGTCYRATARGDARPTDWISDVRACSAGKIRKGAGAAGFTLAEVLAALMFLAIVVPVAVEALNLASRAGVIGTRRAEAARVADRVLNESIVTTNWNAGFLNGTIIERGYEYQWTLKTDFWPTDPNMRLLTAEVRFTASGRNQTVQMNTLVEMPNYGSLSGL
ncbi:MAG TPA: hypothetical protein GYA07_06235 [Verrucomicrobia bacterium]|nr:hypothetical protein [Verrucomicrobiota bacterium]HOB33564.1 hypothetical protein [Verrucomicrobiota bacterium]HOP97604.1 hypothetical protein [Verrucomicrobiota bacterium]HPU57442.1 hypothetical protein [Verrucomicrobiota bacterium]